MLLSRGWNGGSMQHPSADATGASDLIGREAEPGPPATEYQSKKVMLRAERDDVIRFLEVRNRFRQDAQIPSEATVRKRSTPYFGPKLILADGEHHYQLTAPGPDTQLLLWSANMVSERERHGWNKLAEVTAEFADETPQYDLCPECGNPLQTVEHQRKAAVGRCPGPEV